MNLKTTSHWKCPAFIIVNDPKFVILCSHLSQPVPACLGLPLPVPLPRQDELAHELDVVGDVSHAPDGHQEVGVAQVEVGGQVLAGVHVVEGDPRQEGQVARDLAGRKNISQPMLGFCMQQKGCSSVTNDWQIKVFQQVNRDKEGIEGGYCQPLWRSL